MKIPSISQDWPLISVVMSAYNTERYVSDAIRSILAQTYSHFEFIIMDGGSIDGTVRIVRELATRDERIRPFFLPKCNVAHALNAGLAMARGEWVAFMESDDIALPERFAVQMDWIHRTGVDICGSSVKRFDQEDCLLWFPETHNAIRYELIFNCTLLLPTVLMRADIFKTHLFNEQAIFLDYELWTRLVLHYRMGNVQQILLKYRKHSQQTSVLKVNQVRRDLCKFRKPYFHMLFPQATADDYAAIELAAEKKSATNPTKLELAGKWLVRLAQTPDKFVRERMAGRWLATCQRSASLGPACYRLYQQTMPEFGIAACKGPFKLRWMCALRLGYDSWVYTILATVKRTLSVIVCKRISMRRAKL